MVIPKFVLIVICFMAILMYTMTGASAVNTTDQTSGYNTTDIQNNPDTANFDNNVSKSSKTLLKQSSSYETASINITNDFREAYSQGFPNPGNVTNHSNYCNWVWTTINITNDGPRDTNVTIENIESNGFIYYNPKIGWNGYVRFNNGSGWTWDNNFNVTTGLGTYDISSGDTYQIAILGYINQTGNITNTVNEISQDAYSPDPYPSANATLNVPKAAIIRLKEEFRTSLNGSAIHNLNYLDWVYAVTTTTNNGPDSSNVKYQSNSSGFTPNGTYYVSADNGISWVKDGSYNTSTGIWSIKLPSNATYLLAIYGQITKHSNINNTITEISQDVYNPYGHDNMEPKCLIVFDDGNLAQYDIAFKYMQSKGIVGTAYINGYNSGQDDVLTISNLLEMDAAGWIIANHAYDHVKLTDVSDQEIYNEISEQINFLIRNGLSRGAYDLAYPGGYSNQDVYDIMNELGIRTGRTTLGNPIENFNGLNLYQIPAYTLVNTTPVSSVEGYVDNAMASDSTVVILFHNIVNFNPDEYDYLTCNFKNIIDYIAKSGINCITINDLYQQSATAPINIPTIGSKFDNLSTSNGYATATATIQPEADIQINNTASNYAPNYNYNITLTITAKNNGPNTAENVTINEWTSNNYLTYISDDSAGKLDLNTGIWTIGTLKSGQTTILHIIVKANTPNITLTNKAIYNPITTDQNSNNNNQTISIIVPLGPTTITVNHIIGFKGDNVNLIATLTDTNIKIPLQGKTIQFSVNENIIGNALTNNNGIATLPYTIIQNNGTYNLLAQFQQDTFFAASNYTKSLIVEQTPTTSLKAGLYNSTKIVTINYSKTEKIYYTLDGSNPSTSSSKYSTPITITKTTILKYFAVGLEGNKSPTYSQTYTIDKIAPTAKASINGGLYNTTKIVSLSMTENGTIYYTLTGTTPTTASMKYAGPITISSTKILKYLAVDLAGNKSPIYTKTYTIDKIPPKVSSTTPTNLKTGVSRTSTIVIKFSENIKASTYFNNITIKNLTTGKYVTITKSISGNTLYIKMTNTRIAYNWYQVSIPAKAIKDYAGNNLIATYTFKFKTK
ncbi:chitobiase/beta-hexosaminidase C-terminal domain-containing protein [Methanobacterium sp. SMA-27]|uniref:chitobiase/beta-hexosaminidase C-terminal domain-containing protein n=1 Tax=Methanobacterium sp. SMA-27 TaxID=1495336 RepID=UPI00064FCBFA|nr:chitobiase/beta-hexosaminidase C-terminal domain-containing protein [Methanobacterium sp. SMA-27]